MWVCVGSMFRLRIRSSSFARFSSKSRPTVLSSTNGIAYRRFLWWCSLGLDCFSSFFFTVCLEDSSLFPSLSKSKSYFRLASILFKSCFNPLSTTIFGLSFRVLFLVSLLVSKILSFRMESICSLSLLLLLTSK